MIAEVRNQIAEVRGQIAEVNLWTEKVENSASAAEA
jgi:hypothetical protein